MGEDHQELLTAVATPDVARAQTASQAPSDRAQHLVAGHVTVAVVDLLEVIEIRHQDGEPGPVAAGALELHRQDLRHEAAIAKTGQGIGRRELLELLVLLDQLALQTLELEMQLDPRDQIEGVERLGDGVAGAVSQQLRLALRVGDGGQHQEGNLASLAGVRHPQQLLAFQTGQLQIAEHQIHRLREQQLEPVQAVVGLQNPLEETGLLQGNAQLGALRRGVLDDQDARHRDTHRRGIAFTQELPGREGRWGDCSRPAAG